jgi:hypothetical protein
MEERHGNLGNLENYKVENLLKIDSRDSNSQDSSTAVRS